MAVVSHTGRLVFRHKRHWHELTCLDGGPCEWDIQWEKLDLKTDDVVLGHHLGDLRVPEPSHWQTKQVCVPSASQ